MDLKKKKCYGDNGRIAPGDCAGSTKRTLQISGELDEAQLFRVTLHCVHHQSDYAE